MRAFRVSTTPGVCRRVAACTKTPKSPCYTLSYRNVTAPTLSCTVHNVRGRLPVVGLLQDGTTGLRSYLYRIGLRLRGDRMVSLKPFDKTVFRRDPVEVISEEF